ncbi:MAG: WXG100 family type VII secretion target [Chloroflexota bacterium]|nr:WXG100 family type VII secretion target [Chloroflexota bacterium]
MSDKFQAKYDEIKQVAGQFAAQKEEVEDILQKVTSSMRNLGDKWIGRGSEAFFEEMSDEVLPATHRLEQALEEGDRVSREIARLVKQAEQDSSAPFRA